MVESIIWDDDGGSGGYPARIQSGLRQVLTRRGLQRLSSCQSDEVYAPLALLFSPPDTPTMKQFLERDAYYDDRSGPFLDIFPVAYTKHKKPRFDPRKFSRSIEEVERETNWKYSGGTDIIFLCQKVTLSKPNLKLDFGHAIELCVEECIDRKIFLSGSELFERAIRQGRTEYSINFISALASSIQVNGLKSGFMSWLSKVLFLDANSLHAVGTGVVTNLSR